MGSYKTSKIVYFIGGPSDAQKMEVDYELTIFRNQYLINSKFNYRNDTIDPIAIKTVEYRLVPFAIDNNTGQEIWIGVCNG